MLKPTAMTIDCRDAEVPASWPPVPRATKRPWRTARRRSGGMRAGTAGGKLDEDGLRALIDSSGEVREPQSIEIQKDTQYQLLAFPSSIEIKGKHSNLTLRRNFLSLAL